MREEVQETAEALIMCIVGERRGGEGTALYRAGLSGLPAQSTGRLMGGEFSGINIYPPHI